MASKLARTIDSVAETVEKTGADAVEPAATAGAAHAPSANTVERLLLASPRGYCAGVDRAVQTVERMLDTHGAPVYVRKEIVHNRHVVERLRERGAIRGRADRRARGSAVRSRRMASRRAYARAPRRAAYAPSMRPVRGHEGRSPGLRFAREGYTVVLVGHAGHEEVEGTMGEAPEQIVLVQSERDVDELQLADPARVAYITQTTLSVDETSSIVARLRVRFRRSSVPAPMTSATRPPTARQPSRRWPAAAS